VGYHGGGVREKTEFGLFGSQKYITRNRQIWCNRQFLIDDSNSRGTRLVRRMKMDGLSVEGDLAAIGALRAHENFHQGALTCTVFAHQGVDLARVDSEIDPFEGPHSGETFRNPADRQNRLPIRATSSSLGSR
jgi:hypothetical protein